jgi:hypothetical protein
MKQIKEPLGDTSFCELLSSPYSQSRIRGWLRPLKAFTLNRSLIGLNVDPLLQGEELAAPFTEALFTVMHDRLVDARRARSKHEAKKVFNYNWSVPDVTRPTYSRHVTSISRRSGS